jgi:hypothetical protein
MTIWFWLWLALSSVLMFFLGWTAFILFRQKRCWGAYAKDRGLRYTTLSMMAPPKMEGIWDGYPVSLFTSEHERKDGKLTRKLTAVEVSLQNKMPFGGGVASGGMVQVLKDIGYAREFKPSLSNWPKDYVMASDEVDLMKSYLTMGRIEALRTVLDTELAWSIFAFRDEICLLRLDTPDALDTPEKLDKLLKCMVDAARVLEISDQEKRSFAADGTKADAKGSGADEV